MPGHVQSKLFEIAFEQHGYVSVADARAAGVDARRLSELTAAGQAERKSQGLYRFEIVPFDDLDEFMFAAKWPRDKGVISHETAAMLHGLGGVNPARIDVTVPRGYRSSIDPPRRLRIHKFELDQSSVTQIEGVPTVTAERSVKEMIEFGTRSDLIRQAIDDARRGAMITADQQAELITRLRDARQ